MCLPPLTFYYQRTKQQKCPKQVLNTLRSDSHLPSLWQMEQHKTDRGLCWVCLFNCLYGNLLKSSWSEQGNGKADCWLGNWGVNGGSKVQLTLEQKVKGRLKLLLVLWLGLHDKALVFYAWGPLFKAAPGRRRGRERGRKRGRRSSRRAEAEGVIETM